MPTEGRKVMILKSKNEYGLIAIKDTALKTIAAHIATSCYGVLSLSNRKTKQSMFTFKGKEKATDAVRVVYQDGLVIDIHIYAMYGTNIQTISNNIIETLTYILDDQFGLKVNRINVYVDGLLDK